MRDAKERNPRSVLTESIRFKSLLTFRGNGRFQSNLLSLFQYFSGELALRIIGLFLVPLNTRFVTPADYGKFSLVISILESISPAINLGLMGHIAIGYNQYQGEKQTLYISSLFNYRLVHGMVLGFLTLMVGLWLYYEGQTFEVLESPLLIGLLAAVVSLYGFNFFGLNYYNVRNDAGKYSAASVSIGLFGVVINLILLVVFKLGFLGLCIGLLITNIMGLAISYYAIRGQYVLRMKQWAVMSALMFALPALPHLFSGTITRMLDRFFLASVGTMDNLGSLSIAQTLASPLLMMGTALMNLLAPKIYALAASETHERALGRLSTYTIDVSVLMFMLALFVYLFAHLFVALLPESYLSVLDYITYAISACYFLIVYWFVSISATVTKSMLAYSLTSIPLLVLSLFINRMLANVFGSMGVLSANLLVAMTQPVLFMVILRLMKQTKQVQMRPIFLGCLLCLSLSFVDYLIKSEGYTVASLFMLALLLLWLWKGFKAGFRILDENGKIF